MGWASVSPLKRLWFSQRKLAKNRFAALDNWREVCLIEAVGVCVRFGHVVRRDGYLDPNVPTSLCLKHNSKIRLKAPQLCLPLKGLIQLFHFSAKAVDFTQMDNGAVRTN